jgi:hypothetical protein
MFAETVIFIAQCGAWFMLGVFAYCVYRFIMACLDPSKVLGNHSPDEYESYRTRGKDRDIYVFEETDPAPPCPDQDWVLLENWFEQFKQRMTIWYDPESPPKAVSTLMQCTSLRQFLHHRKITELLQEGIQSSTELLEALNAKRKVDAVWYLPLYTIMDLDFQNHYQYTPALLIKTIGQETHSAKAKHD